MDEKDIKGQEGRERSYLRILYAAFAIGAFIIAGRILYIQNCFQGSDPYLKYYRAKSNKVDIPPSRGAILASDGRLLAISTPMYQIHMDCTVRKSEFLRKDGNGDYVNPKGPEKEKEWQEKARELAKGLSAIFGGKSADGWYATILDGRNKGTRYLKIGGNIDHETLQKVKALPLFNEGPNKGGIIVSRTDTRQYPYGSLARRTIGYVKDNSKSNGNNAIGLEGRFDYVLHGKEGYKWTRRTDKKRIMNRDSTWAAAQDGMDIRTTLDIDLQDIADNALRTQLADQSNIEGGCVILMDVKTGAIRAMVNLMRDSTSGALGETYNMAIGRAGEPGSVFKTAILMSLVEDGKARLSDKIPTNHGKIGKFDADQHIVDYERKYHTDEITIMHGYETSSNYVFRKLAIDNYEDNPKKLLDNLYLYKLGEAFDFDLSGFTPPYLPSPESSTWSGTDLGSVAIGYAVKETPLHIATFYNAIANKGRMMKPYLVEDIEKNGIVKEKRGPSVLNGAICSRATADSLTKGLMMITEEGTGARRLKGAKLKVAGKTGTARIVVDAKTAMPRDPYTDKLGRKKYQGTFVGFFPAEQPRYTAIVVIYSRPSKEVFFGGTTPALVLRDIVDKVYAMDNTYGELLENRGKMPDMAPDAPPTAKNGKVPDVRGLGLMDAIYAIENDGYRCSYSGTGHVKSQSPAAGSALPEGGKISIRLE